MTLPWRRIYVGERLPEELLCSQGAMAYASDRLPMRIVGVGKLLEDLIRPMTMSAEDECQIYITTTGERSHGDAMPKKLAGSCNGEAQLLTSIRLVYGSLVQHHN